MQVTDERRRYLTRVWATDVAAVERPSVEAVCWSGEPIDTCWPVTTHEGGIG